jgi:D-3-phosphoglycerate dehydrogenase / 2-oxoglutarate reductase
MMKIYILDAFHPAGPEYAAQHFDVVRWDDPKVKGWADEADGVMVRMTPIRAADLARAKKVKVICKQGVGFDSIDIQAAAKHGIPVLRTPGVNSEAVAEMAMALALSATRRVTECDKLLRAGAKIERPNILGVEMWRKTVGVIGMGNIGSRVARKWQGAFDANVIYYDPYVDTSSLKKIQKLEDLLRQSDLVSIHVPLTDETRRMIGAPQLALMKKTAVLVNTSRGGIVDEAALYDALKGGRLFAAGLDVWEVEPPPKDAPLLSLPNVVGTPHSAGGTFETQERSSLQVAMQVVEVLQGKPPQNRVN